MSSSTGKRARAGPARAGQDRTHLRCVSCPVPLPRYAPTGPGGTLSHPVPLSRIAYPFALRLSLASEFAKLVA
jgi:hypothetical protein